MKKLVPANHRLFEHALAEALAPLRAVDPMLIETLWHAWRCPAPVLPFLAYALSVDFWDDSWNEVRKRRAIAESPAYHRRKGTRLAIEQAASYTERDATITEWWQVSPPARRGTFSVTVHLRENETSAPVEEVTLLKRLVAAAKPKSRAFVLMAGHLETVVVPVGIGILAGGGAVLSVPPDDLETGISPFVFMQPGAGAPLEVQ